MIKLNKEGVILVLTYLKDLRQGERIDQHLSYLERPLAIRQGGHEPPFMNSVLLAGEVEVMLKKCGIDGFLCKVHYGLDESKESLSKDLGLSLDEVDRGIRTALKYISYKWPKEQGYREYRWRRKEAYR